METIITLVENVQWAEVLSADAFSAFEDAGLDDIKVYIRYCKTNHVLFSRLVNISLCFKTHRPLKRQDRDSETPYLLWEEEKRL